MWKVSLCRCSLGLCHCLWKNNANGSGESQDDYADAGADEAIILIIVFILWISIIWLFIRRYKLSSEFMIDSLKFKVIKNLGCSILWRLESWYWKSSVEWKVKRTSMNIPFIVSFYEWNEWFSEVWTPLLRSSLWKASPVPGVTPLFPGFCRGHPPELLWWFYLLSWGRMMSDPEGPVIWWSPALVTTSGPAPGGGGRAACQALTPGQPKPDTLPPHYQEYWGSTRVKFHPSCRVRRSTQLSWRMIA